MVWKDKDWQILMFVSYIRENIIYFTYNWTIVSVFKGFFVMQNVMIHKVIIQMFFFILMPLIEYNYVIMQS